MRCNIALLPKTLSKDFIELSTLFSERADYLLGDHSYPHITLTQFYIADDFDIEQLWLDVKSILVTFSLTEFDINFNKAYSKIENGRAWLGLHLEDNSVCYKLHESLFFLLEKKGISCINASLDKYLPHLTLARTSDLASQLSAKIDMKDKFYVTLGKADELGQFISLLKR